MATTANVLTDLGDTRFRYREMANQIGILVGARTYPRMITSAIEGYNLGLHNKVWSETKCVAVSPPSDGSGYFARVVPIWEDMADANGDPPKGTPNSVSEQRGTQFTFEQFPAGYACTGYEVWAGQIELAR